MSFRDFTTDRLKADFGLTIDPAHRLFPDVAPVPISAGLAHYWENMLPYGLSVTSEKGRSELVTGPLLGEVWLHSQRQVALLSGLEWEVEPTVGLNGVADFLLCRSPDMRAIAAPVLVAVEAKRDSIPGGLGQCGAAMVAAQRFNAKAGQPIDPIYGCVTTGADWRFLRLSGTTLAIDIWEYGIAQSDRILGVLLHCCGVTP